MFALKRNTFEFNQYSYIVIHIYFQLFWDAGRWSTLLDNTIPTEYKKIVYSNSKPEFF